MVLPVTGNTIDHLIEVSIKYDNTRYFSCLCTPVILCRARATTSSRSPCICNRLSSHSIRKYALPDVVR